MPSGFRKYMLSSKRRGGGGKSSGNLVSDGMPLVKNADHFAKGFGKPERGDGLVSREAVRNLAHELRSPLTAIKSSIQLVAEGEAGPLSADQEHFLGLALRNLNRLERMTTDLLDRERSHAEGLMLNPRLVNLGEVLRECSHLHGLAAEKQGLEFDDSGLPESFPAEIDSDRVLQIADNLLSNALKFTKSPGRIHIWLNQRGNLATGLIAEVVSKLKLPLELFTLVVEDNGRGIAPDRQARLFEAFSRVHDEKRLHIPGSGLGLHIIKDLVEVMGGKLSLASHPGQGTTVWVTLPRDERSRVLVNKVSELEHLLVGLNSDLNSMAIFSLDLRSQKRMPARKDLAVFLAKMVEQKIGAASEISPGLWVAGMVDAWKWERAWARVLLGNRLGPRELPWRKMDGSPDLKPHQVVELI